VAPSTLRTFASATGKFHVAIIMDGNGRWATRRGLKRSAGHRAGADAVRRVVTCAPDFRIDTLTLFAFSADNWRRGNEEVGILMSLFRAYLRAETPNLVREGVRLSVIGRRDRLSARLLKEIQRAEGATRAGECVHLRIAVDYSSRDAILEAARQTTDRAQPSIERFGQLVAQSDAGNSGSADVDLLIRTGGEKRLSDFLLWESAYAELWFTDRMWPDFGADDLRAAVADYDARERRFGGLTSGPSLRAAG
jgi:undecaprenyl diphosphate synthase